MNASRSLQSIGDLAGHSREGRIGERGVELSVLYPTNGAISGLGEHGRLQSV